MLSLKAAILVLHSYETPPDRRCILRWGTFGLASTVAEDDAAIHQSSFHFCVWPSLTSSHSKWDTSLREFYVDPSIRIVVLVIKVKHVPVDLVGTERWHRLLRMLFVGEDHCRRCFLRQAFRLRNDFDEEWGIESKNMFVLETHTHTLKQNMTDIQQTETIRCVA